MARFLNALEQAKWHIVSLYSVIAVLLIICLGLVFGWHASQTRLRINIPPQIPVSGMTIRADEVPKSTVYSFAFYIWQNLNYWPQNGSQDFKKAVIDFSSYVTPKFKYYLMKDYNKRLANGELQDRLRTMIGINGTSYDPEEVTYLGHGTWLVHLTMRLTERMDNTGKPIKDAEIDYTLRVVKYDTSANSNKWGLALDGFADEPKRIKTFV